MKPLVYKKAKRVRRPAPVRQRLHVTKGDTVQVISGDDKGKRGRVLRVHPKTGRVTIEGVNVVKRHRRATQTAEAGIVEFPAPIHHSRLSGGTAIKSRKCRYQIEPLATQSYMPMRLPIRSAGVLTGPSLRT